MCVWKRQNVPNKKHFHTLPNSPRNVQMRTFSFSIQLLRSSRIHITNENYICQIKMLEIILCVFLVFKIHYLLSSEASNVYDFSIFYITIWLSLFIFAVDKTPSGFPVITQSPQTRVIEIGHTAVMQCRSTGNPTPKIYWLKDGKRLEMNQRYTLIDGRRF